MPFTDQLRLAAAAYLARFKGSSREHTESDLRSFLTWCAERGLDPLAARRPHLEQRASAIKEAAYGPDHPEVARTLGNLGTVQRELGDLADARATLQRALAICPPRNGTGTEGDPLKAE